MSKYDSESFGVFVYAMGMLHRNEWRDCICVGGWNDIEGATLRFDCKGCVWGIWDQENCWFVMHWRDVG